MEKLNTALKTLFASAARSTPDEIKREAAYILKHPYLKKIADAAPNALMILDKNRQIVFANEILARIVGLGKAEDALGCRTGEVLKCVHAAEPDGSGCGTTAFCRYCGAVQAILHGLDGKNDIQECRITNEAGDVLDLRVWTTPWDADGERFVIFAVTDISDEKRRQALERIFFHDILNTAGGIQGISEIIKDVKGQEHDLLMELMGKSAHALVDEIQAQKQLMAAESAELVATFADVESLQIIREVAEFYANHPVATDKRVVIAPAAVNVRFSTDRTLLRRVIGNLTKNALEASQPGEIVTLSCDAAPAAAVFRVHNPAYMPEPIQLQVFQRSFSTKGKGRGLGTYSIKLLSEKYLKGSVSFPTSPDAGTTFAASYPLSPTAQA